MPLKAMHDTLDEIPEAHRELYREQNGVYPRVYGGTGRSQRRSALAQGLSPCVRGNRKIEFSSLIDSRSIPVCTGEPGRAPPVVALAKVYPRVYGGTHQTLGRLAPHGGLSPCVRGNLIRPRGIGRDLRSIPACTGEPRRPGGYVQSRWVYPRVYGGTPEEEREEGGVTGLSPRVRGNR